MITENRFGEYIANLRKEKEISLEQLSDGLCAISMLSRFERGEREPDKLLQKRFLTRLGVVPENYENFLHYEDYCRWEKRQGILHYILEENMEEAKKLLESYRKEYKMQEALEQQFYLAMLAQIRRYERADYSELEDLFEQALQLTVPEINSRSFRNRILSLEELNLLLEYRFYNRQGISLKFYENLLEYIERMEQTVLAKAKIMPKTVYYYYEAWKTADRISEEDVEHLRELCDTAIEVLRDANRMFYLWELFCMREDLVQRLPEERKAEKAMQRRCQECSDWKKTLEELYEEYGITQQMYEYCYLYVESENYCIDDVIRIRRKMLGMSQEILSQGICDSRTVSRLERHLRKPQKEIVQKLFERLNLSAELYRTELVTDSQEAIEKYWELKLAVDNHEYRYAEKLIDFLENELSLDNSSNRQAIERNKLLNQINEGGISKEEYVKCMKRVLEYTVSYSNVVIKGERYLTNEEIACIENLSLELDWSFKEMRECVTMLEDMFQMTKYLCNCIKMYEFIMLAVSSHWGDIGEYDHSNKIKKKIIKLTLQNRRITAIHKSLYGLLWNEEKENAFKNDANINQKGRKQLEKCIHISGLCKDEYRKKEYLKRMK